MERITLSLPADLRSSLREMAQAQARSEAEVARELLRRAVEEARREAFCAAVEQAMNPRAATRLTELAEALGGIRGESG